MSAKNQKKNDSDSEKLKKELLNVYKKTTTLYEYYSKRSNGMSDLESKNYQEFLKEFNIGISFKMVSDIAKKILKIRQDDEIDIERRILYLKRRGFDCSQMVCKLDKLYDERSNSLLECDWEERDRLEESYDSKAFPLMQRLHNATINLTDSILGFCDYLFDVLNKGKETLKIEKSKKRQDLYSP